VPLAALPWQDDGGTDRVRGVAGEAAHGRLAVRNPGLIGVLDCQPVNR
jgi:hypothetical protein